jgi:hypothetical protein
MGRKAMPTLAPVVMPCWVTAGSALLDGCAEAVVEDDKGCEVDEEEVIMLLIVDMGSAVEAPPGRVAIMLAMMPLLLLVAEVFELLEEGVAMMLARIPLPLLVDALGELVAMMLARIPSLRVGLLDPLGKGVAMMLAKIPPLLEAETLPLGELELALLVPLDALVDTLVLLTIEFVETTVLFPLIETTTLEELLFPELDTIDELPTLEDEELTTVELALALTLVLVTGKSVTI